jgi:hypothetical protein
MRKTIVLGLAAALAMLGSAAVAHAEVRVSGAADDITLRADGATLVDILAGLETVSHARIELKGNVPRQFTGTYSGSLHVVLSRLLAGIDHVVRAAPDRMTVIIVASRAMRAPADATDVSGVQGWVPTRPLGAETGPAPSGPLATDTADKASAIQGWVPPPRREVASSVAIPQAQSPPSKTVTDDAAPASSIQGWVPPGPQVASAAMVPQAQSTPPQPATDDAAEASPTQGWVPLAAGADRPSPHLP